jgi:hypothetical protein
MQAIAGIDLTGQRALVAGAIAMTVAVSSAGTRCCPGGGQRVDGVGLALTATA